MKSLRSYLIATAAGLALVAGLASPPSPADAAASTQTLHAFLCAPAQAAGSQARRVVNTSSTASPQPSYLLNSAGCAVIANADVGFFISQGFQYGPNIFTLQQTGVSLTNTSTATNMSLPPFATILNVSVEETAGNAVTGGLDVGDSGTQARFISALTVGANANVGAPPVLSTGSGTGTSPAADVVYLACHSACSSAPIVNVTILYSYY